MSMNDISKFFVSAGQSLRAAMDCINRNTKGIALVVSNDQRLAYTITDGDLRRAVLSGFDLESSIDKWAKSRTESGILHPLTAPSGSSSLELLSMMQSKSLKHIPLLDEDGRVVDLAVLSDMVGENMPVINAVVMAGGFGMRLRPLTDELPKPMLRVGDRPVMEHILNSLRDSGIRQVMVTTHYKSEAIVRHFGNGERFGVALEYLNEDEPLGTAGALGLLRPWTNSLLVINGDILTRLNHQSMLEFHRENKAMMTVGVRQFQMMVPYGVVETEGALIRGIDEKPTLQFFVNAGVYLLEPEVCPYLKKGQKFDMTDLIASLLEEGKRIVSYPISEDWLDIGGPSDYDKAQNDFGKEASS